MHATTCPPTIPLTSLTTPHQPQTSTPPHISPHPITHPTPHPTTDATTHATSHPTTHTLLTIPPRLRYLDLHVANQEQTLEGLRLHVQRIDADRRLQAAAVQEQQDAQDRQLAEVEARLAGLEQGEGAGGMGAGSSRAQALQVSRAACHPAVEAPVAWQQQRGAVDPCMLCTCWSHAACVRCCAICYAVQSGAVHL
jgi:hypothetical protein